MKQDREQTGNMEGRLCGERRHPPLFHSRKERPCVSKRLSDAEYAKQGGYVCPFCGSINIEGVAGVDVEGGSATQEIRCTNCDRAWQDVYRLIGYQSADNPEGCDTEGEASRDESARYLMFGDIEPELFGPFTNEDERDRRALELREQDSREEAIFRLNIDSQGKPSVLTYSGAFFEKEELQSVA